MGLPQLLKIRNSIPTVLKKGNGGVSKGGLGVGGGWNVATAELDDENHLNYRNRCKNRTTGPFGVKLGHYPLN